MILLDTHVLLWLWEGSRRLGTGARLEIDRAWRDGEVCVSAFSFWEVSMLRAKGRIRAPEEIERWRREQIEQGLVEVAVDGEIGIRAANLPDFVADPADRLIVARSRSRPASCPRKPRSPPSSCYRRCPPAAPAKKRNARSCASNTISWPSRGSTWIRYIRLWHSRICAASTGLAVPDRIAYSWLQSNW